MTPGHSNSVGIRWGSGYSRPLSALAFTCAALGLAAQLPAPVAGTGTWDAYARVVLLLLLAGYAALFWVRLATEPTGLRREQLTPGIAICLVLGLIALLVNFPAPRIAALNVFWWTVGLATAVGVAGALGGWRPALLTAEAMLVLVLLHSFGDPQGRRHLDVDQGDGISWSFSFERPEQRIVKRFQRPEQWNAATDETFVRVDLAGAYEGRAGYAVTVNDTALGKINGYTKDTIWQGPGGYRWGIKVPPEVMAKADVVTVELSPDGIDSRLRLAGHGDPQVEALGRESTWLFDGSAWTRDRLAGTAAAGPVTGTYRIWLIHGLRPPETT